MDTNHTEIRVEGKTLIVPSLSIAGRTVIITGKWIKRASVHDDELFEGEAVEDPAAFISRLTEGKARADVFTFAQKPTTNGRQYPYHAEWDNWAAIRITTYNDWWEKRLPQEARKNVRRAAKRGIEVKVVRFDDDFVRGIQGIYNETPVRQGRPFWHFGKDFEQVKLENGTYPDRSEFLGAYLKDELVGFIKIIYVGSIATLIQIIAKNEHHDKRPMNALLAKAVEVCEGRGASHLVYGKYVYGRNQDSSLTEFKRRNGFEEIKFPRYFVPLSARGRIAVWSGLHRGWSAMLPSPVRRLLLDLRARFFRRVPRSGRSGAESNAAPGNSHEAN